MQAPELYKKEFVSKNEYDQDRLAFIEAEAELEKAQLADLIYREYQFPRDEKQKMSDVDEAVAEIDRVKQQNDINLKAKESTRANRQRQLQMREENLAEEKEQLAKCTIHAPQDGLVVYGSTAQRDNWRWQSEGPLAIGRNVGPNDLLIVLPDTSEMIASVKVHESMAGRVRAGQAATVSVEALGLEVPGVVESIGVLAESGGWRDPNRREYTVKIALETGEQSQLKPSMRCEARLVLGRVQDALTVPVQAVFNDGAVAYVYTPSGAKFARTPALVGRRSDVYAEITAGLEAGDRVLVRRPGPGEVIPGEWDTARLEELGYIVGEDGKAIAPFNPAMMQRMRGGARPGEGGAGRGAGASRSDDAGTTESPAEDAGSSRAVAGSGGESGGEHADAGGSGGEAAETATQAPAEGAASEAGAAETAGAAGGEG